MKADEAGVRRRWLKTLEDAQRRTRARVAQLAKDRSAVEYAKRVLARHRATPRAASRSVWHPKAKRAQYTSAGFFVTGRPKIAWHTTEGSSLPSYNGSAPHFTLDPRTGDLWQHIPIDQAAKALEHPAGTPETNRAHVIQVELIGKAAETGSWPKAYYVRVAGLARWIEANAGVPRSCGVAFKVGVRRMTGPEFVAYSGHCGHCHVPSNSHWDPGNFRIEEVL